MSPFTNNINVQPRIAPYVGRSEPRSITRNQQSSFYRQTFSVGNRSRRVDVNPILQPLRNWVAPAVETLVPIVSANQRTRTIQIIVSGLTRPIVSALNLRPNCRFVKNKKYFKQNRVVLWDKNDICYEDDKSDNNRNKPNKPRRRLENLIGDPLRLSLNPKLGDSDYPTLLEALQQGSIELEWEGLINIWLAKMLNPLGKHWEEFIVGLGFFNAENYLLPFPRFGRKIMGRKTYRYSKKIKKVQRLYAFIYLGIALNLLILTRPTYIQQRDYDVQAYLRYLLFREKPNQNETMFAITYKKELQFALENSSYVHKIDFCCPFNLFRIKSKTQENDLTKNRTLLNMPSCYPLFPKGKRDKIENPLWVDALDTGNNSLIEQEKIDRKKFEDLVKYFKSVSIFTFIKKLHPNLAKPKSQQTQADKELYNKFTKILGTNSLNHDEEMIWPENEI